MNLGDFKLAKEKLPVVIGGAAASAVLLAVCLILYLPLIKEFGVKHGECRSIENHLAEACNMIEQAKRTLEKRTLITEKNVSTAIDEVTDCGKSIGINFISITPNEKIDDKSGRYKILPVEMKVAAKDEQFLQFLGALDDFEKALIRVKSFDIVPDKEDRSRLTASLVIDIYLSTKEYEW